MLRIIHCIVAVLFVAGHAAAQDSARPPETCVAVLTSECLFEEALAHDEAWLQLADEAIRSGNFSQARRALERLRAYAKLLGNANPRALVQFYIIIAHNYGRIGDTETARRDLLTATALLLSNEGPNASIEILTEIAARQQTLHAFDDVRETVKAIAQRADSIPDEVRRGRILEMVVALQVYAGDPEAAAELDNVGYRASVLAHAAAQHSGRSSAILAERLLVEAERATKAWMESGSYGLGYPSAVFLSLARAKGRLGDKQGALADFRRALAEQDRDIGKTPRYVNRIPIALAMIEDGAIAEALASTNALEGSELALVHRAAARAYLRRGQLEEARQAAARASIADRVRILVEIAGVAGRGRAGPILSEARYAAEASKIAAASLADVAQGQAKQGWFDWVRKDAKRYVAEVQTMVDAYERGEALKSWIRAQILARDLEGARETAQLALRVAQAAGEARSMRAETMSHETEKEISLRAAAEAFALIGELQAARDAANLLANKLLRALALASASRHAALGGALSK